MTPEESALRQSIETLYEVFSPYALSGDLQGCPCCTSQTDQMRIRSKPLRALSVADLDHFAAKALTTWGVEDDLKHFLPRLLELLAFEPLAFTLPQALVGKLTYTGRRTHPHPTWHRWPEAERRSLMAYFETLWVWALTQPAYPYAEDWLQIFVQAYDDLTPFLHLWWSQDRSEGAVAHLALFLHDRDVELQGGRLNGVYWRESAEAMHQVISWANDPRTGAMLRRGLPMVRHLPWLRDQGVTAEWMDWVLS